MKIFNQKKYKNMTVNELKTEFSLNKKIMWIYLFFGLLIVLLDFYKMFTTSTLNFSSETVLVFIVWLLQLIQLITVDFQIQIREMIKNE